MIRDVRETSKAYVMQYSGQKRRISEKSDSGRPADYSSSGRAGVLSSSYRSSDTTKSDFFRRAGWDNQSKPGFQPSKFPKIGKIIDAPN